jgi:hypothetical protein
MKKLLKKASKNKPVTARDKKYLSYNNTRRIPKG